MQVLILLSIHDGFTKDSIEYGVANAKRTTGVKTRKSAKPSRIKIEVFRGPGDDDFVRYGFWVKHFVEKS